MEAISNIELVMKIRHMKVDTQWFNDIITNLKNARVSTIVRTFQIMFTFGKLFVFQNFFLGIQKLFAISEETNFGISPRI